MTKRKIGKLIQTTTDDILKPIQPCVVGNGQHAWIPTTGEGMQCYSCPMCRQYIYWSDITDLWVKVSAKVELPPTPNVN